MKNITFVFIFSTVGALSAMGQLLTLDSGSVSLTSVANTTIATSSSSGNLGSIGCTVTTGVTGSPVAVLKVTANGNSKSYSIYSTANTFPNSLVPYVTSKFSTIISQLGSNIGDAFLLPINISYPANLTVEIDVTTAAGNGVLTCSALHS